MSNTANNEVAGAVALTKPSAELRWGLTLDVEEENPVVRLNGAKYKFAGVPVPLMFAVLNFLNGREPSDQEKQEIGLTPEVVSTVVEVLCNHQLAVDLDQVGEETIAPEKCVSLCRSFFPFWKEKLVSHPLWGLLASGEASQAQFVGWLVENFHFIEGIHDRLAVAIAECDNPDVRALLSEHYSEEHDHSIYFMSSLNALGYDPKAILNTRPLPGTRAVLNFMRQCGRRDSLQYGVCTAFFEASGGTREAAEQFYGLLMKPYIGEKLEAIDPLVEHVALDNACGHDSFIDDFVNQIGPVSLSRASAAISACALLVETLYLWTTDIMRAYDQPHVVLRNSAQQYRYPDREPAPL
ncbi:MAG TPA: iron-containing redox enzyme family protein [Pyrinomonadaceae bacterium]|nr:iron-containing redox enzyme family protein [Pyrinomonadaceae bacterium]